MLDIWFLLYRKGLISGVKLSVVVPQATRISLHNRIGDSAREFLVVVLWGLISRHSMYLNCSFSLVSVSGMGACMPGRSDWYEACLILSACLEFMHLYSYTRVFDLQSRIYTGLLRTVVYALYFSLLWKIIGC